MADGIEDPDDDGIRHSKALQSPIITDPEEVANKEAANALLQIDLVNRMIDTACDPERQPFRLVTSAILQIHGQTLEGLDVFAGAFRAGPVKIGKSKHKPPASHLVPGLVQVMCDYVNENWEDQSAIYLSAYVLWRMNWIHPFTDGNGRTARAVSNLVLCGRLGGRLPGTNTIPEQIAADRRPYYDALEAADETENGGQLDLSEMESLLTGLLATQLMSIHKAASCA